MNQSVTVCGIESQGEKSEHDEYEESQRSETDESKKEKERERTGRYKLICRGILAMSLVLNT